MRERGEGGVGEGAEEGMRGVRGRNSKP